jgi:predicted nucleic acid-binding protein
MDESAKKGEIFVVEEVLRELEKKDDGIHKWVKQREAIVVPIDDEVQKRVVEIMFKYGRLVDTKKNRSVGDPWVVALALVRGLTVVTGEKASGNLAKPKIPDVCKDLSLSCIEMVDFFRKQGWRW